MTPRPFDDSASPRPIDDPRLTAYALGELSTPEDRAEIEALLARSEEARREVDEIRAFAREIERGLAAEPSPALDAGRRAAIEARLGRGGGPAAPRSPRPARRYFPALAAGAALVAGVVGWRAFEAGRRSAEPVPIASSGSALREKLESNLRRPTSQDSTLGAPVPVEGAERKDDGSDRMQKVGPASGEEAGASGAAVAAGAAAGIAIDAEISVPAEAAADEKVVADSLEAFRRDESGILDAQTIERLKRLGYLGHAEHDESADSPVFYPGAILSDHNEVPVDGSAVEPPAGAPAAPSDPGALPTFENQFGAGSASARAKSSSESPGGTFGARRVLVSERPTNRVRSVTVLPPIPAPPGTESYGAIVENGFVAVAMAPLSTFSIDVDTASYANVRRFLDRRQWPPSDAVRLEEMVNYFRYAYAGPEGPEPIGAQVDAASCPWAPKHRLVRVALKGRETPRAERAPANLVFLVDVSGSMDDREKLPLVQSSLTMLLEKLDPRDRVAIVTYAGDSGVALPSTPVSERATIQAAIDGLRAGGNTNGGAGIELAYRCALEHFDVEAVNRVIFATDGDFNTGITDRAALENLIVEKARSGVFLSVLGFGTGNLKDGTAELLADKGNGNYAYIDSLREAEKVLVREMGSTLVTIAKDVKVQVEWNPAKVAAYRLLGYENRALAAQDFNDDRKDAGEIGEGHTVTALYEVIPVGVEGVASVDPLKYQPAAQPGGAATKPDASGAPRTIEDSRYGAGRDEATRDLEELGYVGGPSPVSGELLTVKLRWKEPQGEESRKLEVPFTDDGRFVDDAAQDFRFAAAVAEFAMILRGSPHRGDASFESIVALAEADRNFDPTGDRADFVRLVRIAQGLAGG